MDKKTQRTIEAWKAKQPAKAAGPKLLQHFAQSFNQKQGFQSRGYRHSAGNHSH